MSGTMGDTPSNIASDDNLKRERYNLKRRNVYKNLSPEKKKTIQRQRAQKSQCWRDMQKKKNEVKVEEIRKGHQGEMEDMRRKLAFEKNRMVLYALPGLGLHRNCCPLILQQEMPHEKQLVSRRHPISPSFSVIIPLHGKAILDVAVASHLLIPTRSGTIKCHHESVQSLEIGFGEGLIFFDNLVHRGGKSDSPDIRCFGTVGNGNRSFALENKNYSRNIAFCRDEWCDNCESLRRVKERNNGEVMNVKRESDVYKGEQIDKSMSLLEHGFVIVKVNNDSEATNSKFITAVNSFTEIANGSVDTMTFGSMSQEIENLDRLNMKRMILNIPGGQKGSDYIRMMQPEIHSYLEGSFLTIGAYLHSHFGLNYNVNDFTLLRNGDNGTGLQQMHSDKLSICTCRKK